MKSLRIDYRKTRDAVTNFMKDFKLRRYKFEESKIPRLVRDYTLTFSSGGNNNSSPTENQAIKVIELGKEYEDYFIKIVDAFNRLGYEERQYMSIKFLNDEFRPMLDEDIRIKMNVGERVFINIMHGSYKKFALMLDLEVYEK